MKDFKLEFEQNNQRALIRLFALNVEFECKLAIANSLSDTQLEELGINVQYENYYVEDIADIQIRKLWLKMEEGDRTELWKQWFPNISILEFDSMVDALLTLKNQGGINIVGTDYDEGVAITPNEMKDLITLHQDYIMADNSNLKTKRTGLRQPNKYAVGKWSEPLIELLSEMRTLSDQPFLKRVY